MTSWQTIAACRGSDPDLFYPERGEDPAPARDVCARCKVKPECLAAALVGAEPGIWGGLSYRERRTLTREMGEYGRWEFLDVDRPHPATGQTFPAPERQGPVAARRAEVAELVDVEGRVTADDVDALADLLDVSAITIQRDLAALRQKEHAA